MPPLELIIIWKNQSRFTPTVLVLIMLDDNWIHEFLGILLVYAPNAGKNACLAIGYYLNGTEELGVCESDHSLLIK